jgi:hypothetical protein
LPDETSSGRTKESKIGVIKISSFKPAVPKRVLLFVAAIVWTFAGSMLLYKGFKMLDTTSNYLWLQVIVTLAGGIVFFWKMFSKISLKHTNRILNLKEEKPCLFSFFNFRSYLLMALMISMGITLRRTGWIAPAHLAFLYLTMSVPLLLSSVRFYYTGFNYSRYVMTIHDNQ